MKTKKYILITISFLFGLLISAYSIKNIFLANSPTFNPYYLSNLSGDFQNTKRSIARIFVLPRVNLPSFFNKNNQLAGVEPTKIPDVLFKNITKGVSAYEKNDEIIFRIGKEAVYSTRKLKLENGKEITVLDFTKTK